jgi:hypothetical protein
MRQGAIDATDNSASGGAGLREPDLGRDCGGPGFCKLLVGGFPPAEATPKG